LPTARCRRTMADSSACAVKVEKCGTGKAAAEVPVLPATQATTGSVRVCKCPPWPVVAFDNDGSSVRVTAESTRANVLAAAESSSGPGPPRRRRTRWIVLSCWTEAQRKHVREGERGGEGRRAGTRNKQKDRAHRDARVSHRVFVQQLAASMNETDLLSQTTSASSVNSVCICELKRERERRVRKLAHLFDGNPFLVHHTLLHLAHRVVELKLQCDGLSC
jgi:hypothetical protein